jgi:chaperone modulatory protein CbpM
MITFTAVLARLPGLQAETLQYWITQEWVRPTRRGGEIWFGEIDVARLHLIRDLHDTMEVGEGAMPVVLSLLDQLHETRRQMRRLCEALDRAGAGETAQDIVRRLAGH